MFQELKKYFKTNYWKETVLSSTDKHVKVYRPIYELNNEIKYTFSDIVL